MFVLSKDLIVNSPIKSPAGTAALADAGRRFHGVIISWPSMPLAPGTQLGRYEITTPLGAGGMGEVYRARDSRLKRVVAIKVLPSSFSCDQDKLRRFEQEACAAAALNHPNILSVYDVGTHAGVPFIVSELLEGVTLRYRLQAGLLPMTVALDYARQIASGLAASHDMRRSKMDNTG